MRRPSFKTYCLQSVCCICASAFALSAFAADSAQIPPKSPVPVAGPQQTAPTSDSGVNRVTQAAVQAGVLTCATRINQVSNFVTTSSQNSAGLLFPPRSNPDQSLVSVSLEVQHKDAPAAYVSASFAPNQANGCGALYESVAWWENACDTVANKQFGGLSKIGLLGKGTIVLDGGALMRVFLMPAGKGCVSVKKELVQ